MVFMYNTVIPQNLIMRQNIIIVTIRSRTTLLPKNIIYIMILGAAMRVSAAFGMSDTVNGKNGVFGKIPVAGNL